jgi:hypothetical protein
MVDICDTIFISNPLIISQNDNIHDNNILINKTDYDYIFKINISKLYNDNITLLFNNASYYQNTDNLEDMNININLDKSNDFLNWNFEFNNQNLVTLEMGNSNVGFNSLLPSISETIGDRLLETVAHKLFGNGLAKAAISNDTEFYNHDSQIWDNLANSVSQDIFKNDIFNQYKNLDRYIDSNKNWIPFNFDGLTFSYPMYLIGSLENDSSLPIIQINLLKRGYKVGGTQLQNGMYNIPILIKFH